MLLRHIPLMLAICGCFTSSALAEGPDVNQGSHGAVFGFDTAPSPRRPVYTLPSPATSSVPYSLPLSPHRVHPDAAARAKLKPPGPYIFPFDGNLGYTINVWDFWSY